MSLSANSAMAKERSDYLPVVIFTEENMDADKPVPMVTPPPVILIGGLTR